MTTSAPSAKDEGRTSGSGDGFTGRGGWHLIAFFAAMALVLAMSIDWYTTQQGEEFRRVEDVNRNSEDSQRLDSEDVERAGQAAENEERNAWQADAFVDRLLLIALLVAFVAAVVAAFMRSAGRRPDPPWNPSAIATVAGVIGTLLVLYRMVQPPGLNDAAVLKSGAPIGLAAVGILTVASRLATLTEKEERAGGGDERAGGAEEPEAGGAQPSRAASSPPEAAGREAAPPAEPALDAPPDPGLDVPPEPAYAEDAEEAAREARRRARERARAERGDLPAAAQAEPGPTAAAPPAADEVEFPQPAEPEPERHEETLWAIPDTGRAEPPDPDAGLTEPEFAEPEAGVAEPDVAAEPHESEQPLGAEDEEPQEDEERAADEDDAHAGEDHHEPEYVEPEHHQHDHHDEPEYVDAEHVEEIVDWEHHHPPPARGELGSGADEPGSADAPPPDPGARVDDPDEERG